MNRNEEKQNMRMIIDPALPQWKGNFHCHTTGSDGWLTPREAAAQYRAAGYDFLAITDHRRVTEPAEAETDLLLIPGVELDYRVETGHAQAVHIIGVGVHPGIMQDPAALASPQQGVDAIRACGGLAIFAHPAWSLNDPETIKGLKHLSAVEIYNRCSDFPWNARRADSSEVIDLCFADGFLLPIVAADDAHRYNGDQCHSAVIACAEACTRESILDALDKGNVYGSQGPRITEMKIEDGEVALKCTPCRKVIFYSDAIYSRERTLSGEDITEARYRPLPRETYIRVEIEDENGLRAWSSPVRL
ncbi:MAG: CehA/McbA family metallohydrolase [Clostridiales bacterium]|nr:CehA/McbA family metallohydrolase [Clostridiales bacterium]